MLHTGNKKNKITMKTILESAQEYATEHFKEKLPLDAEKSFIDGFLAGANFVQEWISVKDELPEHGKTVLIMCDNKYIGLGCIRYGEWDYKYASSITHWRPITKY